VSAFSKSALLADGRIFGLITQNRPQKIFHGRKNLEAVKWQNLAKSGRKEAGKYFSNYLDEKPYNYEQFLTFYGMFFALKGV
jgi:hypothetical protein